MLEQIVGELPRDALDGHQVLRGRLREIFRGLEPGIDQGLRARLADSLDAEQVLVDAGVVYLRRRSSRMRRWIPSSPGLRLSASVYARRASSSRPILTSTSPWAAHASSSLG